MWVISKGQWHKAKVILIETDKYPGDKTTDVHIYRIHYPGWGKRYSLLLFHQKLRYKPVYYFSHSRYDETMFSDSLMLQNAENDGKAEAENYSYTDCHAHYTGCTALL